MEASEAVAGIGHNAPPEPTLAERLAIDHKTTVEKVDALRKEANDVKALVTAAETPDEHGVIAGLNDDLIAKMVAWSWSTRAGPPSGMRSGGADRSDGVDYTFFAIEATVVSCPLCKEDDISPLPRQQPPAWLTRLTIAPHVRLLRGPFSLP